MITSAFSADCCWTDPLTLDIDTILEHQINHGLSTDPILIHLQTALFPGANDLILAEPLPTKHDAIMWDLVHVNDILETELDSFMIPTQ